LPWIAWTGSKKRGKKWRSSSPGVDWASGKNVTVLPARKASDMAGISRFRLVLDLRAMMWQPIRSIRKPKIGIRLASTMLMNCEGTKEAISGI